MIASYTLSLIVVAAASVCVLWPATLFLLNLRRYRPPPGPIAGLAPVSVLIPARNEESTITAAIAGVLNSRGIPFELIVLDDASTDRTAEIVSELATSSDGRVRLEPAAPLPAGWNGKQHACWQLARLARHDVLCFLDADVRLEPEALARMASFLGTSQSGLVSGFPRQVTVTWLEKLLIPLIHFVLLSFLPMRAMRRTTSPACAASCGQFLMVRRDAYFASGGHSAIRATMHDGLLLPKLLRQHGHRTDLADLTELATCRMYTNAADVWNGLAKNATEGIGSPARILPISAILLLGQVYPVILACVIFVWIRVTIARTDLLPDFRPPILIASTLLALCYIPRLLAVFRFRQSLASALLHPVGIIVLLTLQWYALARKLLGSPITWKSRAYAGGS